MNASHVHLILNHVPLFGMMLGLTFFCIFLFKRDLSFIQTGLLIFVLTGLVTIPTITSGEGAEEVIEHIPGIEETRIEKHEEIAEKSLFFIEAIAGLSLLYLILLYYKKKISNVVIILAIILSAGCSLLLLFVNKTGGEIRHTEIRQDTSPGQRDTED